MGRLLLRCLRRGRFIVALCAGAVAFQAYATAAFALACGPAIYGVDTNGKLYTFTPPSATATLVASPGQGSGTISRGSFSGNVYLVAPTAANSPLYLYNTSTSATTQAGTFPNTAFVYASGFNQAGVGYALSSTQSFSFTDANPSTITPLPAPATTSGPALSAFNSGDLAFDQANNGWTILSNNKTGISYLYRVTFSTGSTSLSPVGQITLGGKPYTTADLYSVAFGADGTMYAAAGSSGTLYAINTATGALTSDGSQGVALDDLASCPFVPQPSLVKNGPSQVAAGELVNYTIVASNAAAATDAVYGLTLQDPLPTGISILTATCSGTAGVLCATPAVSGQTVSTTVNTIPAAGSATLKIFGRDAGLSVGTTTNTAQLTAANSATLSASASVAVIANSVTKTVANVTQNTAPTQSSDQALPGNTLEYVLSYTNNTNAALGGFRLSDTIPPNTTYVVSSAACVATPSGLTCSASGPTSGVLAWAYAGGALAPGQSVSVKFRVTVN